MATTSVFEVTIGDASRSGSHIQLDVEFSIGESSGSEGRAQLNSLLGADPELFCPYAIVHTSGGQHADEFVQGVNAILDAAGTGEISEESKQEGSGPRRLTHHGENVIIKGQSDEEKVMMVEGMLQGPASALLQTKNSLQFSVDIGDSFESVMQSDSFLDLLRAAVLKLEVNLQPSLRSTVNDIVEAVGLPPEIQVPISMVTLFRAAECKLSFDSPDMLPATVKTMLFPPVSEAKNQVKKMLKLEHDADKAMLQLAAAHTTGKVTAYFLSQSFYVKVTLKLPGLTQFLS